MKLSRGLRSFIYCTCAIIVHLIFSVSIFDIYFKSPIVHGVTPFANSVAAPARRLVLIIADGLRAQNFYEMLNDDKNDMYLRFIIETKGAFGVSNVRVPTESRTGHVGIIAGMNEDVSAVLTGWQQNPVEFDSVFNESRYTWSWGSPDILPLFSKSAHRNHVFTSSYGSEELDFAASDASRVDTWVFEKFRTFLDSSKTNDTLATMLSEDKTILFLHLLGIDITGHSKKPASVEYKHNINLIDGGIRLVVSDVENYFNHDGRTTYILTADHGMTDWGSHGSGSLHETETPIVAWGAGIRGPVETVSSSLFSFGKRFEKLKHSDISQVDLAPFMAAVIGINFPLNSVGVLPLDYLNVTEKFGAYGLFTNAQQILAMCQTNKERQKNNAVTLFFKEYSLLTEAHQEEWVRKIQQHLSQGEFTSAIESTNALIQVALDATRYYETYDRFVLNCAVIFGFLSWMIYLISFIVENYTAFWNIPVTNKFSRQQPSKRRSVCKVALLVATLFICYQLKVRNSGLMYYTYFLTPLVLSFAIECRLKMYKSMIKFVWHNLKCTAFCLLLSPIVFILEVLVFSFFYREILSLGLLALSTWPWFTALKCDNKILCVSWTISNLCLSMFPLFPVVGKDSNYPLVYFSGCLALLLVLYCIQRPELKLYRLFRGHSTSLESKLDSLLLILRIFLLALSIFVKYSTVLSLSKNNGLPLPNQILAWIILVCSCILPFFGSTFVLQRLFNIAVSLVSVYLLMSTTYEVMFLLCLCITMCCWIYCECELSSCLKKIEDILFADESWKSKSYWQLSSFDVQRAYFFIYYIFTAFFGTGNVASLSSFDPASLYCFVTVFNPFGMGAILMLKMMIPFLMVACSFYAIVVILHIPVWSLFAVVLLMSDFMSMHFFLLVQDTGSWLDIGSSISRYIIMMSITIFVIILYLLAQLVTTKRFCMNCVKKTRSY